MVSEANEPGSESGKRSDDRRAVPKGTAQEGGASTPLAAPGSSQASCGRRLRRNRRGGDPGEVRHGGGTGMRSHGSCRVDGKAQQSRRVVGRQRESGTLM